MSTRCNIVLHNNDAEPVYLYHHHDGYPMVMGPKLEAFVAAIADKGIDDPEEFAAEMSRLSCADYMRPMEPDSDELTDDDRALMRTRRGRPHFEHADRVHGDIEYLWRVYLSETPPRIACEKIKPRHKPINYVQQWAAELVTAIAFQRKRLAEAERSDPGNARDLRESIAELEEELEQIRKRLGWS